MRLIDADELLKNYGLDKATKYGNKDVKQLEHSYSTLMLYEIADMIKDAPTAYDVDKVVEQFEKCVEWDGYTLDIKRRGVEIIKAGGKSETT